MSAMPVYVPTTREIYEQMIACKTAIAKYDAEGERLEEDQVRFFTEGQYSYFANLVINLAKFAKRDDTIHIAAAFPQKEMFYQLFGRVCDEIMQYKNRLSVVKKIAEAFEVYGDADQFQFIQEGSAQPSDQSYDWGRYLTDRKKVEIVFLDQDYNVIGQKLCKCSE